jgi:hypothetical protein
MEKEILALYNEAKKRNNNTPSPEMAEVQKALEKAYIHCADAEKNSPPIITNLSEK